MFRKLKYRAYAQMQVHIAMGETSTAGIENWEATAAGAETSPLTVTEVCTGVRGGAARSGLPRTEVMDVEKGNSRSERSSSRKDFLYWHRNRRIRIHGCGKGSSMSEQTSSRKGSLYWARNSRIGHRSSRHSRPRWRIGTDSCGMRAASNLCRTRRRTRGTHMIGAAVVDIKVKISIRSAEKAFSSFGSNRHFATTFHGIFAHVPLAAMILRWILVRERARRWRCNAYACRRRRAAASRKRTTSRIVQTRLTVIL